MEVFQPQIAKGRGVLHDLGLPADPVAQIAVVRSGIAVRVFVGLAERLGVPEAHLAEVVGMTSTTLTHRKRGGALRQDEGERVLRIAALFERAAFVFVDESDAADWLRTPNLALGGVSPLAFADTGIGARQVEDLLGCHEHGVYPRRCWRASFVPA